MKFGSDKKYERLLEAFGNGDISRRDMMRMVTVAAAAVGVVGGPFGKLTREALAAVEQVRFDGWGGIVSEAFHNFAFPPFTEKTGIKVVEGEFGDTDEFLTQVKAAQPGEYNIFLVSGVYDYARFNKAGFGAWINEANIPNLAKVLPATLDAFTPPSVPTTGSPSSPQRRNWLCTTWQQKARPWRSAHCRPSATATRPAP